MEHGVAPLNPAEVQAEPASSGNCGIGENPHRVLSKMPSRIDFERLVWRMRRKKEDGVFDANRFPWQTRIIVENLLDDALENKGKVEIFKGNAKSEFYESKLRSQCERLMDASVPVRLIFAESAGGEVYWKRLRDKHSNNLEILTLPEYDESLYHYCLIGDSAYRLEFPHPHYDGPVSETVPERPARFSFNDTNLGSEIKKYAEVLARRANTL